MDTGRKQTRKKYEENPTVLAAEVEPGEEGKKREKVTCDVSTTYIELRGLGKLITEVEP